MPDNTDVEDVENIKSKLNSQFADVKTLITGGAGFLGSWLCDILTATGAEVHCIDNLSTGLTQNIEPFQKRKNFKFTSADVAELPSDLGQFKYILHLASRASPASWKTRYQDATARPTSSLAKSA